MSKKIFTGSLVAIVTPFKGGKVDHKATRRLVDMQVEGGTSAIVVSGTTGESPTLTEKERLALLGTVIEAAEGKVNVVAGTGSNNTAHVVESSKLAQKAGADALLVVTPYYNKPTQDGLLAHYRAVADAVDIPIILYSVPGRTGVAIAPETVAALAEHENIGALKEAGGDVDRVTRVRQLTDLPILSGDDPLTLPMLALGAQGVVSVTANIAPREISLLVAEYLAGDTETARELHYRLYALNQAMFLETNPLPVKTALHLMGQIEEEFRLPLVPMRAKNKKRLKKALKAFGIPLA